MQSGAHVEAVLAEYSNGKLQMPGPGETMLHYGTSRQLTHDMPEVVDSAFFLTSSFTDTPLLLVVSHSRSAKVQTLLENIDSPQVTDWITEKLSVQPNFDPFALLTVLCR